MNRELMRQVADSIRTEKNLGYCQGHWFDYEDQDDDGTFCGTTACVAGHAVFLSGGIERLADTTDEMIVSSEAARVLELTPEQYGVLFAPIPRPCLLATVFNVDPTFRDRLERNEDDLQEKIWMARVLETIAEHGS